MMDSKRWIDYVGKYWFMILNGQGVAWGTRLFMEYYKEGVQKTVEVSWELFLGKQSQKEENKEE